MCNNSLIYLVTPTVASVAEDGVLPLTTIVRRRGSSIQQSNDSIVLGAPGAGTVTVNLLQNGTPVQGATASTTITTATTEVRSLSFDAVVRVPCCGSPTILTVVNDGVAITTSNIAIDVEYLD